tara:strand:+ start:321 stop:530 length:210 start_codon:yes stop_codon:yes gene_type:complete
VINHDEFKIAMQENQRLRKAIKLYGNSINRKALILAQDSIQKKEYATQQKGEEIATLASLLLQTLEEQK